MRVLVLTGTVVLGYAAGAVGAALMIARIRRVGAPVDTPDPRRLHEAPTPRAGGIGIVLAGLVALVAALVAAATDTVARLVTLAVGWASMNGVVGLIDDHHPLGAPTKLAVQLV